MGSPDEQEKQKQKQLEEALLRYFGSRESMEDAFLNYFLNGTFPFPLPFLSDEFWFGLFQKILNNAKKHLKDACYDTCAEIFRNAASYESDILGIHPPEIAPDWSDMNGWLTDETKCIICSFKADNQDHAYLIVTRFGNVYIWHYSTESLEQEVLSIKAESFQITHADTFCWIIKPYRFILIFYQLLQKGLANRAYGFNNKASEISWLVRSISLVQQVSATLW